MLVKQETQRTATNLAEALFRERDVLRQNNERRASLKARITRRENQYQMKSEHVHEAIHSGRLKESQDVCDWIIDYELVQRAGI